MNVLIIDNNLDQDAWGSSDLRRYVTQDSKVTAHVRRGPAEDLPATLAGYDRVVISGSRTSCLEKAPWITHLDSLIREGVNRRLPILGVCYGHQALNRVIGGREILRKGTNPEFGWSEIETLAPNALFEGLPKKFYSYSSHWEEVSRLPKGMHHLARSERCDVQACQYEDAPIFGIQFHPERNLPEALKSLERRKQEKNGPPLLNANASEKLYRAEVAEAVFRNFLKS